MREKGIDRVKEKIARGDLTNTVLKLEGEKSEKIQLDEIPDLKPGKDENRE